MVERINIEIIKIKNGFLFEDDYITNKTYCETFEEVVKLTNHSLKRFKKIEKIK